MAAASLWSLRSGAVFFLFVYEVVTTVGSRVDSVHSGRPLITSPARIYQQPEGGNVSLSCDVRGLGSNTVVWKQGERTISAGTIMVRVDSRMGLQGRGLQPTHLRIQRLRLEDGGNYTCEVEWNGTPLSVTHSLTVLQPPRISSPTSGASFHVTQGESLSVVCTAHGDPQPMVWWSRRSRGGALHRLVLPGLPSILQLQGAASNDSGQYVCQARNNLRTVEVSIHLAVHYLPVVSSVETRVYSGEGARAELGCLVEGFPQPAVTWLQRVGHRQVGVRQDSGHRHSTLGDGVHTLVIRRLSYTEVTNFTCRAENEVGTSSSQVEVTGLPQPPRVTSQPVSLYQEQYSLALTVESVAPLMEVKLLYRVRGGGEFVERGFTPGNRQTGTTSPLRLISYRLERLNLSTTYEILSSVRNSYGWSEVSELFTFRTLDQDYPEHPRTFFGFHSASCPLYCSLSLLAVPSLLALVRITT